MVGCQAVAVRRRLDGKLAGAGNGRIELLSINLVSAGLNLRAIAITTVVDVGLVVIAVEEPSIGVGFVGSEVVELCYIVGVVSLPLNDAVSIVHTVLVLIVIPCAEVAGIAGAVASRNDEVVTLSDGVNLHGSGHGDEVLISLSLLSVGATLSGFLGSSQGLVECIGGSLGIATGILAALNLLEVSYCIVKCSGQQCLYLLLGNCTQIPEVEVGLSGAGVTPLSPAGQSACIVSGNLIGVGGVGGGMLCMAAPEELAGSEESDILRLLLSGGDGRCGSVPVGRLAYIYAAGYILYPVLVLVVSLGYLEDKLGILLVEGLVVELHSAHIGISGLVNTEVGLVVIKGGNEVVITISDGVNLVDSNIGSCEVVDSLADFLLACSLGINSLGCSQGSIVGCKVLGIIEAGISAAASAGVEIAILLECELELMAHVGARSGLVEEPCYVLVPRLEGSVNIIAVILNTNLEPLVQNLLFSSNDVTAFNYLLAGGVIGIGLTGGLSSEDGEVLSVSLVAEVSVHTDISIPVVGVVGSRFIPSLLAVVDILPVGILGIALEVEEFNGGITVSLLNGPYRLIGIERVNLGYGAGAGGEISLPIGILQYVGLASLGSRGLSSNLPVVSESQLLGLSHEVRDVSFSAIVGRNLSLCVGDSSLEGAHLLSHGTFEVLSGSSIELELGQSEVVGVAGASADGAR